MHWKIAVLVALSGVLAGCGGVPSAASTVPDSRTADPDSPTEYGDASGAVRHTGEPTTATLQAIVESGKCVRLERMPLVLSGLHDPDFRDRLGSLVRDKRQSSEESLTAWLVLAHAYQELCDLRGEDPSVDAATYVSFGAPLNETFIESSLKAGRCRSLLTVDELQVWPYEARLGQEVIDRRFADAEITRRLWIEVLGELAKSCEGALDRRTRVRLEAQIGRLDRIIGLDDPTLIELRTKMLEAIEAGQQEKVLAYAQAVNEREKALDSRGASAYDAKLAEIEKKITESKGDQSSGTKKAADASRDIADTAENVANTVRATKAAVDIVRTLF